MSHLFGRHLAVSPFLFVASSLRPAVAMSFQVKIVISRLLCEQDVYFLAVLRMACQVSDDDVVLPPLGLPCLLLSLCACPALPTLHALPALTSFPATTVSRPHCSVQKLYLLACIRAQDY